MIGEALEDTEKGPPPASGNLRDGPPSIAISLLLDSLEPSFALRTKLAHPVSGASLEFRVVFIFPNRFLALEDFEQAPPPIAVILFFHALTLQSSQRRISCRSRPIVVFGPWPGIIAARSSSVRSFPRMERRIRRRSPTAPRSRLKRPHALVDMSA